MVILTTALEDGDDLADQYGIKIKDGFELETVISPTSKGIALIRRLAADATATDIILAARQQDRCILLTRHAEAVISD